MELFRPKPRRPGTVAAAFDTRELMDIGIVIRPSTRQDGTLLLGAELQAGTGGRLHPVLRLRDFLGRVEGGKPAMLTRTEAYRPEQHRLREEDDRVLRLLMELCAAERLYRPLGGGRSEPEGGEALLAVPPVSWKELAVRLGQASRVRLSHQGRLHPWKPAADRSSLGIELKLTESRAGEAELAAFGLEELTILEDYGLILRGGVVHDCGSVLCGRLAALQGLLRGRAGAALPVAPEHLGDVAQHMLPALGSVARVELSRAIEQKLEQPPLQGRLYLDRVKDRLLADLEFQYGDTVFRPLESGSGSIPGRIIVRDTAREIEILELMAEGNMAMTERGCYAGSEEEEFNFLHHIVPRLELLLRVYATSAVRTRLHRESRPPIVRIDTESGPTGWSSNLIWTASRSLRSAPCWRLCRSRDAIIDCRAAPCCLWIRPLIGRSCGISMKPAMPGAMGWRAAIGFQRCTVCWQRIRRLME